MPDPEAKVFENACGGWNWPNCGGKYPEKPGGGGVACAEGMAILDVNGIKPGNMPAGALMKGLTKPAKDGWVAEGKKPFLMCDGSCNACLSLKCIEWGGVSRLTPGCLLY